jgi:O-antigen/teichoic acid export membrane protein
MRLLPGPQGAAWVVAETATSAVFSLVGLLFVARVIGPQQAGLGALAASAFLLIEGPASMLFGDALMQRRHLSPEHIATAFWVTLGVSVAAAVVLALLAPLIAAASGLPEMVPMLQVLALLLPLSGLGGMFSGLALRERWYRLLALRTLIGQPLALAAGIAAGLHGAGAWALVVQQSVASVAGFALMALWFKPWPAPRIDRPALKELWAVAGPQVTALVVMTGRYRAFLLVLGLTSSELVVAATHVAFRMVDVAGSIVVSAIGRLAAPRLAALQHNRTGLAESFGMLSRWQSLGGLPVALGLAVVAPRLIEALMGPAWAGAAAPAQVVGISAALWIAGGPVMALWLAMGRTRMNLWVQGVACVLPLLLMAVLRPSTPAMAAWCWASTALLLPAGQLHLALQALHRGWFWLAHWMAPALLAALAMLVGAELLHRATADWPAAWSLAAMIAAGGLAWAAALVAWRLLHPGSRDWLSLAAASTSGQE